MDITSLLIHSAGIARVTKTPDGRGGWTEGVAPIASAVACRCQPLSAIEKARYASLDMEVGWKVYFASLTVAEAVELNEKDLISVEGYNLEIVGLYDTDLLDVVIVAMCTESVLVIDVPTTTSTSTTSTSTTTDTTTTTPEP